MPKSKGIYRRNPAILERLEKIRLFHTMGMTTHEMADVLDVSQSTAQSDLRELGLKPHRTRIETRGIRSIKTLPLCEECEYDDCVWNACMTLCPMQLKQKEADI